MPELDYRALSRRAQTELQRQKNIARWVFFAVSLGIYLLFLVMGWGFFLSSGVDMTPEVVGTSPGELLVSGMIMLTIAGGLSIMFQFFSALLDTRVGEAKMRERIMGRLVTEEVMRLGEESGMLDDEKAKRMSISDEGELEETLSEDEIAAFEARRSQARK